MVAGLGSAACVVEGLRGRTVVEHQNRR
jgi:hypothetical protein